MPNPRGRPMNWTQETAIAAIQAFVAAEKRVPNDDDVTVAVCGLPSRMTLKRFWPHWEDGIRAAGYEPVPQRPRFGHKR